MESDDKVERLLRMIKEQQNERKAMEAKIEKLEQGRDRMEKILKQNLKGK